jgi:hypothetical protein
MVRLIISLLFFYFGLAMIVATLAENIFAGTNSLAARERTKMVIGFSLIGVTLLLAGWILWPSSTHPSVISIAGTP